MGFDISMKFFSKFRMWAMLAAVLMAIGTRAEAQGFGYSLSWSGSPNPVGLNSNLTYTVNLTNLAGAVPYVYVTNTLDVHSTFVSATITNTSSGGFITTNGHVVAFSLIPFDIGEIVHMTVIVQPTAVVLITNTMTFTFYTLTNFSTNIINQVTNAAPLVQADLAVAMTGPSSAVFTNDWMTYGVSVTNLGPSAASNVMLTNTLPPGVGFKNYSPSNQVPNIQGSNVIFNLGTMASGAFTNFLLLVQPTNAGVHLPFSSFVNSTSVTDPNPTNNAATTNITVGTFIYGQLIATNSSAMNYDPQIGLMTNTIRLTNIGTNVVAAARVIVSGLTNWLYNAVGTNNGNPYVVSGQLNPNQSTNLMLELFVPTRLPITVTNYTAVITLIASNNIQPGLPAIPTQTVNELTLLTVTNTATEPSPYATTLGYGLVNPLTGMAIDTNGIITWTPAQNQSPSTNTITTVVTNSDPFDLVNSNLMATNSFTVIVREVNTAPALPVIPTQTINELTLLTVTNTATNSNIHATILGYGLVGSPTNMSISTSGIIIWTPAQNQSPSTNTITTVVTNSDPFDLVNPQLTATNSFTVIVFPFVLTGPVWLANGEFQFVFTTGVGGNYTIQYSTNLTGWISIYSFTSPGGSITVQDPNAATSPWRFYRVLLNP